MTNAWTTFFNALVDVCEEYNNAKRKAEEKEMEVEFFSDIFAEPVLDKSDVVDIMAECGWSSLDMKLLLNHIKTPEQAKTAIKLIKRGYSYYDVKGVVDKCSE